MSDGGNAPGEMSFLGFCSNFEARPLQTAGEGANNFDVCRERTFSPWTLFLLGHFPLPFWTPPGIFPVTRRLFLHIIRYDMRICYFSVSSKADISQLNPSHGTKKIRRRENDKLKNKKRICSEIPATARPMKSVINSQCCIAVYTFVLYNFYLLFRSLHTVSCHLL